MNNASIEGKNNFQREKKLMNVGRRKLLVGTVLIIGGLMLSVFNNCANTTSKVGAFGDNPDSNPTPIPTPPPTEEKKKLALSYGDPFMGAINSPFIIHPKTLERGSGLWIGCSQSRQNTWPSEITVDSETCAISGSASSALINFPLVIDAENSSGEKVQATLVMNIANKSTYEFVKSSETYLFTGSNFIVKIPVSISVPQYVATKIKYSVLGMTTAISFTQAPELFQEREVNVPPGANTVDIEIPITADTMNSNSNDKILQVALLGLSDTGLLGEKIVTRLVIKNRSNLVFRKVVSRGGSVCAVTQDSVVKCWGRNDYYQLGSGMLVDDPLGPYVYQPWGLYFGNSYIDLGGTIDGRTFCGLTSGGDIQCWGHQPAFNNNLGWSSLPTSLYAGKGFQKFEIGQDHLCGTDANDSLWCWGYNSSGQLGDGSFNSSKKPISIDPVNKYLQLALAENSTCAITATQKLRCWGKNESGILGLQNLDQLQTSPITISPNDRFQTVDLGTRIGCAIKIGGTIKCWTRTGELNVDESSKYTSIKIVPSSSLYPNYVESFCGITDSNVLKCYKIHTKDLKVTSSIVVDEGTAYKAVTVSGSMNCGITTLNTLKCWDQEGLLTYNQNPKNNSLPVQYPIAVQPALKFRFLSEKCGILESGELRCSGERVGDGTSFRRTIPVIVDSGTSYVHFNENCGVTTEGRLRCIGPDGLFSGIDQRADYVKVAVGLTHLCALTNTGQARCKGEAAQLGGAWSSQQDLLVDVDPGTVYIEIAAGNRFTCGITNEKRLRCWGSKLNLIKPTFIDDDHYNFISTGEKERVSNCLINSANKLKCFSNGIQMVEVDPQENYSAVATNQYITCGLTLTGKLKCWGTISVLPWGSLWSNKLPTLLDTPNVTFKSVTGCGALSNDGIRYWFGSVQWAQNGTGFIGPYAMTPIDF